MAHRLAREAEADLDELWLYIAKESGSMDAADRLVDSLTERFWLLARNPYVGRSRDDDLRTGLRSFPVGMYLIIYRVEDGDVVILRVVQGNRDIQALFRQ